MINDRGIHGETGNMRLNIRIFLHHLGHPWEYLVGLMYSELHIPCCLLTIDRVNFFHD
jgi:hypothetical protein